MPELKLEHEGTWWLLSEAGAVRFYDGAASTWVDWDGNNPDHRALKPPPGFLLNFTPANKRKLVRLLASTGGEKYNRPFAKGQLATMSIVGSESWTDYAQVVLQLMLVDSMATLEEQLSELNARLTALLNHRTD
jgi:hypothetical protein